MTRYIRFRIEGLYGYLDVHVDSLTLVRANLLAQQLTWKEEA